MDKPKFCKDCKHYESMPDGPVCKAFKKHDLVTGHLLYLKADSARKSYGDCGYEASQFEPVESPPLWQILAPAISTLLLLMLLFGWQQQ